MSANEAEQRIKWRPGSAKSYSFSLHRHSADFLGKESYFHCDSFLRFLDVILRRDSSTAISPTADSVSDCKSKSLGLIESCFWGSRLGIVKRVRLRIA